MAFPMIQHGPDHSRTLAIIAEQLLVVVERIKDSSAYAIMRLNLMVELVPVALHTLQIVNDRGCMAN